MHIPSGSRDWMGEGLCAGLSVLGSIAIFELLDKPDPSATLVALLISAAVGSVAGRWIVRSFYPERAAIVSAVVLIAVIIEVGVPAAWHHLLVDPSTWHRVASSLRAPNRANIARSLRVGGSRRSGRAGGFRRPRPPKVHWAPSFGRTPGSHPGHVVGRRGARRGFGRSLWLPHRPRGFARIVRQSGRAAVRGRFRWDSAPCFSTERDHGCSTLAAGRISCGGALGIRQRCARDGQEWVSLFF